MPRPRVFGSVFLGLLFLSGAAALGCEVVAARILHRVLGSTSYAVAGVLAGFLGGLGLGALVAEAILARRAARSRRAALKAYAACEFAALCGALLVLASSPALSALVALPGGDVWIIAGVVLLAIPWGASFPFAVAAGLPEGGGEGTRQDGDNALEVHVIYGANALGGAVGALAVGLFLVPGLGEANALAACAMLEALAGGGAVILARRSLLLSAAPAAAGIHEETTAATTDPRSSLGLVAAFLFLSGFAGLYWEVLWTRILVLVAGSTVYAFSIIAGGTVLGIAAGSFLLGHRRGSAHGWLLPCFAGAALGLFYSAVDRLPDAYLAVARTLGPSSFPWGVLGAGGIAFILSAVLGGLFPWAVAITPQRSGALYAVNSFGAILGAYAAGPFAASTLPLEASYLIGVAACLGLVPLGAMLSGRPSEHSVLPQQPISSTRVRALAVAGSLIAAGVLSAGSVFLRGFAWDARRLLSGVYQWSASDVESLSIDDNASAREILLLERGSEAIVTVELAAATNTVFVRSNGKVEGSVPADIARPSLADLPTQILLGELPAELLARPRESDVLVLGLGCGVTLGALLSSPSAPDPARVDVIEIEEAFLRAIQNPALESRLRPFYPPQGVGPSLASGPRLHFGDARRLLARELSSGRWDAIISQPSEPWVAGAAPLFTTEFFDEAAQHLKEGGFFFQWLQLYKVEWRGVEILLRTFRRTFPEVHVLRPPATGELILVGSFLRVPIERLLEAPPGSLLAAAGIEVPADRLAIFIVGARGLDALVGFDASLPINTDSRSELEFLGARSLHGDTEAARAHLARLEEAAGGDTVAAYLPERLRGDRAFLRVLAARNLRLGGMAEALALLEGDSSPEADELRVRAREGRE